MNCDSKSIAVIGAGSWGTALAMVLSDNGYTVDIYTRFEEQKNEINQMRTNKMFLPEIKIPDNIVARTDIADVVKNKKYILLVVPSHAMRETVKSIYPYISSDTKIIHAAKGIELDTFLRMSEVIREETPKIPNENIVVLSGPSHAEEVSRGLPTTVVIAGEELSVAEEVQDIFMNNSFRVYTNKDIVGTEIAGALKNIIALGAGVLDGLEFGDNARAALMTRGLSEISRLGTKMGADPVTFSGLTGVGDLIVTCTSKHSRNWRAGYMLGQGKSLDTILDEMGMVVEGVKTTKAAFELSKIHQVEMPITHQLYNVLFEGASVKSAVEELMGRIRKHELEGTY